MSRLAFLLMLLPFSFLVSAMKPEKISRSQFPKNFLFGTASSAYQVKVVLQALEIAGKSVEWFALKQELGCLVQYEGAVKEGGRGPSIWDSYTHTHPGHLLDSKALLMHSIFLLVDSFC